MTTTSVLLLSLIAWSFILVMTLGVFRTMLVFTSKRKPNEFAASGSDLTGFGQRLTRAHANCYEHLPAVGLILLYAIVTNNTGVTDPLAYTFLGARMAQSVVHILSTSNFMVLIRFGFFAVQLVIVLYWLLSLAGI